MRSLSIYRGFGFYLLVIMSLGAAPSAFAHRLDLSATVDYAGVHVAVKDSFGTAISKVAIEVTDPDGKVLARGNTDAGGRFTFKLAATPEHINVTAKSADGHKAALTLSREQLTSKDNAVIKPKHEHVHENEQTPAQKPAAGDTKDSADHALPAPAPSSSPAPAAAPAPAPVTPHAPAPSPAAPPAPKAVPVAEVTSEPDEIDELHGLLAKQQAALDSLQAQLLQMSQPKPGVSRESVIAGLGLIFGLTGLIASCYALRRASRKGA
jgi:hypothetical protein